MAKRLGIRTPKDRRLVFQFTVWPQLTSPFYSVQALSGLVSMYTQKRTICFPIKIQVSVWSNCTNVPRSDVYFTLYLSASLTIIALSWRSFIFSSCSLGFLYLIIENTPYTPKFVLQMLWSSRLGMCLYFDFSKKRRNLTKVRVNIKLSTNFFFYPYWRVDMGLE